MGARYGAFVVASAATASGGKYVHVPVGVTNAYATPTEAHKVTFCMKVVQAGTYKVIGRVYAANTGTDSFYVKVGNSTAQTWNLPRGSYANSTAPGTYALGYGTHLVTVYLRESGARLDKLELRLQATPTPTAT